jgi:hypothetical protein
MRHRLSFTFAIIWLLGMAACSAAPTAAPQPTLAAGLGGISGSLSSATDRWPDQPVTIFAAPYLGGGTYILDPLNHPQTKLDAEGNFVLVNLAPSSYVLIAGPSAEQGSPVLDDAGQLLIIEVIAGSILPVYNLYIH